MRPDHWPRVREIYLEGVATENATFETSAPSWEQWDAAHHPFARVVAIADGIVTGWAALTPTLKRAAYAGVADVSVYVAEECRGIGSGRRLLEALIGEAEKEGIWTLQANIFPENAASLKLHRGCGFLEVGRRERIAKLNGVWRDTVLMERRSRVVGID